MSTKELEKAKTTQAIVSTEGLSQDLVELMKLASIFVNSGLLPETIDTPQKAFLLMQQGKELGLLPMQSINNIIVIKGKTSITTNLMRSLILKTGRVTFRLSKHSETECEYIFTRDSVEFPPISFTIEEAKKAGLANPNNINWTRYTKDMLSARAFARGARIYCADIIQGMYTSEELEDERIFDGKGGVADLKISESIEQVFQSMMSKIEKSSTALELNKIEKQIKSNVDLGLISEDKIEELRSSCLAKRDELNPPVQATPEKVVDAEVVVETPVEVVTPQQDPVEPTTEEIKQEVVVDETGQQQIPLAPVEEEVKTIEATPVASEPEVVNPVEAPSEGGEEGAK